MKHFQPYTSRRVVRLPIGEAKGWRLKRYAIVAGDREYDPAVAVSALDSAIKRLPVAGRLDDSDGNHGVGFQIIHFAEVAIVSPVFYWMWGSVLANTDQARAPWSNPNNFKTGVREVVGCVWELEVVCFETNAWKNIMLGGGDHNSDLVRYMDECMPQLD